MSNGKSQYKELKRRSAEEIDKASSNESFGKALVDTMKAMHKDAQIDRDEGMRRTLDTAANVAVGTAGLVAGLTKRSSKDVTEGSKGDEMSFRKGPTDAELLSKLAEARQKVGLDKTSSKTVDREFEWGD